MNAMLLEQFGGVENFHPGTVPLPRPGADEVLVQVKAIGINPIDLKTRAGGGMAAQYGGRFPVILGWDVSGVVTETGGAATDFAVGDEVFGTVNFPGPGSAYAEYIAAPAGQLALKPAAVDHVTAASATLSALTAWQALVDAGGLKRGDRVLIHGAAGGVGHYAVQIAKHFGGYVVGTASGDGVAFAREIGADEVIDYKTRRFEETAGDFDLILDTVGGENFVRSLQVLKPDGAIILLPSDKKAEADRAAREHRVRNYFHILMHSDGGELRRLAAMLADGTLRGQVDRTFPFSRIPDAHTALENGSIKGKIVVTVP